MLFVGSDGGRAEAEPIFGGFPSYCMPGLIRQLREFSMRVKLVSCSMFSIIGCQFDFYFYGLQ